MTYSTPTREDGIYEDIHGVDLSELEADVIQKLICDAFVVLAHKRRTTVITEVRGCYRGLQDAEAWAEMEEGGETNGEAPNTEWGSGS